MWSKSGDSTKHAMHGKIYDDVQPTSTSKHLQHFDAQRACIAPG